MARSLVLGVTLTRRQRKADRPKAKPSMSRRRANSGKRCAGRGASVRGREPEQPRGTVPYPRPLHEGRAALRTRAGIREKVLGADHPDVAMSLNNLAMLYMTHGQYAKAEPLYKRALAIEGAGHGPPRRGHQPQQPGGAVRDARPVREGRAAVSAGLAIREKALGTDHPDVATSLNNLALLYITKASTRRRSRSTSGPGDPEKALGKDHPDVAQASTTWRGLYETQGQYAKAEPLYQRAWRSGKRRWARTTPTWPSLNNLARCTRPGPVREGGAALPAGLAIQEKALGEDHPDMATSLNNLAALYDDQASTRRRSRSMSGRWRSAKRRWARTTRHGPQPQQPGAAVQEQGQYAKAEPLYGGPGDLGKGAGQGPPRHGH